jgi:hypothetical protein
MHHYQGNEVPPIVSINQVLSDILTNAISLDSDTEGFWTELGSEFQSVKFPNLSPVTVENPQLLVTSRFSSTPLADMDGQCQQLGISLQATGQGAWARLLSAYTGESNISFGLVLSGRDVSRDAQEAVFPCLVTVPFQCRTQGSNRDLVATIMRHNARLVKRQFAPLSKVQRWLKTDKALFDSLFVYQKFSSERKGTQFWDIVEEDARIDVGLPIRFIHLLFINAF